MINEGIAVYRSLSPEQREQRLQRSGLEAALTMNGKRKLLIDELGDNARVGRERSPVWEMGNSADNTYKAVNHRGRYRQRYAISIYNLAVLDIAPLGAGSGMKVAIHSSFGPPGGFRADQRPGRLATENQDAEWANWLTSGESSQAYAIDRLNDSMGAGSGSDAERNVNGRIWRGNGAASGESRSFRRHVDALAIRALYSLGLDSGEVLLTAMGGRRYVVEAVTPLAMAPGKSLPEPHVAAAQALARSLASEQPGRPGLLMGMDPEFLLLRVDTGRVVPASRYLPMAGVAGCDAGPPGTRGAFPVAELRPKPRGEPRALLAQLMSAAATADRLIADRTLAWRAGGMPLAGWALGGHLHFSGVTLTAPLLRALDNYLALPITLLEDARASSRRPRYGVLGDFRYQPHGGFEYRTLPSFLVSPVIAKGVVHLAHLIVSHYEDLPLRPLDREDLHAAYYSGDRTPLRAAFVPLAAHIRALGGYEKAAPHIEPLLRYISAGRTWDESRDIRRLWQVGKPDEIIPAIQS
ncbi:hypothetical protein [Paenibacillus sp. GCM10012306]|uniref:putative amidoligase domain-containing protein n=1 Tax=Paenibacillus sp. GCM10012306 TaxID=3317342 RepID=UPI00361DC69F